MKERTCDIFCRVIDNFGDIGVCWRLARQLRHEYNLDVRLWLDDINALVKIWPEAQALVDQHITAQLSTVEQCEEKSGITTGSRVSGIEVCVWHGDNNNFFEHTQPFAADIIIEAFACHIPDTYLQKMKQKAIVPFWFNLEYLSAEKWIEDCHGLSSIHPATGMKKIFFFPGFNLHVSQKSGGLIREKNLIETRDSFLNSLTSRIEKLKQLGIHCSEKISNDAFWISLFTYENAALPSLMQCWSESTQPILCLIPDGKSLASLEQWLGHRLQAGEEWQRGQLTLKVLPFIRQDKFDHLLWLCDCNFVRGEDSFVRAQWAGKPFVWHIYPQEDHIHFEKLKAFLAIFAQANSGFSAELGFSAASDFPALLGSFWLNWNQEADCCESWLHLMKFWPEWQAETENWTRQLLKSPDLAQNLLGFAKNA